LLNLGILNAIWGSGAFFRLISFVVNVAIYAMGAFGLYKMAIHRSMPNPWLAWIPFGSNYLSGSMVGEMELFGIRVTNLALLNLLVPVGGSILSSTPLIGQLIWLAANIFVILVHYNLFKQYRSDNSVCILYAIFSFIGFFMLRDDNGAGM